MISDTLNAQTVQGDLSKESKPVATIQDYEYSLLLDSPDDAIGDYHRINKQQMVLAERLMEVLDPANVEDYGLEQRKAAALLLGRLRARQAVPFLIVLFKEETQQEPILQIHDDLFVNSAFNALADIGRDAIPAIVGLVKETDDPGLREKAVALILHCVGTKRFLLDVLRRLAEKEENGRTRDRLVAAHNWAEAVLTETEEPIY
jgi:hypothetical protein